VLALELPLEEVLLQIRSREFDQCVIASDVIAFDGALCQPLGENRVRSR